MSRSRDHQSRELSQHPLLEQLLTLHEELRGAINERWNRSVPFADALVDRWERAAFLGFGGGTSVYDSALILGDVSVGEHTWIGPHTVLDGSGGGLSIGSYCMISAGVQVYTHHTVEWSLTGGRAEPKQSPVAIGERTYIGPQSVVSLGVNVGNQVVIGAGSLVTHDVPDASIVFGVPGRIVGRTQVVDGQVELLYEEPKDG